MPVAALLTLLFLLAGAALNSQAQDLPRCSARPTVIIGELFADNRRWCPEDVVQVPEIEPYAFTALAVAPDGALYATRPLSGQVMVIRDSDDDGLPDASGLEVFASGLTRPNGLAYHVGFLYVAGERHIYRIAANGAVETLVDDLPSGTGFWTGGLAIGVLEAGTERLYVAIGAPCDNCVAEEPGRGAILSMNLAGGDRQIVASGFRQPADLSFFRGQLWTLDSAPRQAQRNALDELNRVQAGGWYGFPYCLGAGQRNSAIEPADSVDCEQSVPPVMRFGSGATPSSLAAYPHDSLPGTKDTLIVVLSGDPSQVDFVGYKVIMLNFDDEDKPLGATILMPYRYASGRQAYLPYQGEGLFWERYIHINEQGWGFYPQQPLAVAVGPPGWIYISITGGRIIALRPRYEAREKWAEYPLWTPMNPNFDPAAEK